LSISVHSDNQRVRERFCTRI